MPAPPGPVPEPRPRGRHPAPALAGLGAWAQLHGPGPVAGPFSGPDGICTGRGFEAAGPAWWRRVASPAPRAACRPAERRAVDDLGDAAGHGAIRRRLRRTLTSTGPTGRPAGRWLDQPVSAMEGVGEQKEQGSVRACGVRDRIDDMVEEGERVQWRGGSKRETNEKQTEKKQGNQASVSQSLDPCPFNVLGREEGRHARYDGSRSPARWLAWSVTQTCGVATASW